MPGDAVVSQVELQAGVLSVRFGLRVGAPAKKVYERIAGFLRGTKRGLTKIIDGLRRVTAKRVPKRGKKGGGLIVRFRGELMRPYDVSARVWPKWRAGAGVVVWRLPWAEAPNTGRLQVDPAPGGCIVSLQTKLRIATRLPTFLLKLTLKTAIAAAGAALRAHLAR